MGDGGGFAQRASSFFFTDNRQPYTVGNMQNILKIWGAHSDSVGSVQGPTAERTGQGKDKLLSRQYGSVGGER